MTCDEFISIMKSRGVSVAPAVMPQDIINVNLFLQQIDAAILPNAISELYSVTGGMNFGSAYIFGPKQIERGLVFPVPCLGDINQEMKSIKKMHGLTVFGRNDLFLFAFDAFGTYQMLDNVTFDVLRKYDDVFRVITDCLAVGK